jgi:site-specific DNA-methyltransferase (adenine-specific)
VIEFHCADVVEWARGYTGPRFHGVLCDPPYELGFMGKAWDRSGVAFQPATWEAIGACLVPGAHLLAFGGTRTFHRLAVAIEGAGFEIRDTCMYLYGSGFPKSHNLDGDWAGYGTALKPAWEPCIVARWPLGGTVAENCQRNGAGALWIDGCRIGTNGEAMHGSTRGEMSGAVGSGFGFNANNDPLEYHALGRWPANLIHDGSDEVMAGFPDTGSSRIEKPCTSDGMVSGYGGALAGPRPARGFSDTGSAARYFYTAKASRRERDAGLEWMPENGAAHRYGSIRQNRGAGYDEGSRVRNPHPTVKPLALCEYLARLILPPPVVVPRRILVPFAGSGSEAIGAMRAGWDEIVGVEMNQEYVEIARARAAYWAGEMMEKAA